MDAHGKRERVSFGAKMLRDALGEELADSLTRVDGHGEKAGEEVKEGVRAVVIERSACVRSVL